MIRALPAALLAVAAVASPTIRGAATATASFKHPVVTVHAKEFAFIAPASITAGTTTFRLVNDGKEVHQISILQLAKGKTLADYIAAMTANKPAPWAVGVGGPNAAGPGQTIDATLTLDAGNYILVCWVPSPGAPVPHMVKGMIQPLTAGKHTIHVMNTGTQEHEAVIMKLAPGKTMKDADAWFESGMKGPSPIEATPGMAGLGKGRTASFTTNLTPGNYGLICYIPDAKDGKPHAMHGMVQEFTVAAK